MFKTPKDKLNFLMLVFFAYISAPILEWFSLLSDLENGSFSANKDSVGLPFGFFIFGWISFSPFILGFVIWVLWKYPLQVSLFDFNSERPIWTSFWSLIFACPFFYSLILSAVNIAKSNFAGVVQNLLFIYLLLILRATVVFRNKEMVANADLSA